MAYGMVAKNEHGVLLSADQKNYVFAGYYAAPVPVGSLYTFNVAATALSIYGIRLPVGGQGSVISMVAILGGYRVTVLGVSVTGLLVFTPISGGGRTGYGFSLFNGAGACTFDSNQKHLAVTASGQLYEGGRVISQADTVIYIGAGIHPTLSYTQKWYLVDTYTEMIWNGWFPYTVSRSLWYLIRQNIWTVSRSVASRSADGYTFAKQLHLSGWYNQFIERKVTGGWGGSEYGFINKYTQFVGALNNGAGYPYAASAYNTTQNLALVTDSALYL